MNSATSASNSNGDVGQSRPQDPARVRASAPPARVPPTVPPTVPYKPFKGKKFIVIGNMKGQKVDEVVQSIKNLGGAILTKGQIQTEAEVATIYRTCNYAVYDVQESKQGIPVGVAVAVKGHAICVTSSWVQATVEGAPNPVALSKKYIREFGDEEVASALSGKKNKFTWAERVEKLEAEDRKKRSQPTLSSAFARATSSSTASTSAAASTSAPTSASASTSPSTSSSLFAAGSSAQVGAESGGFVEQSFATKVKMLIDDIKAFGEKLSPEQSVTMYSLLDRASNLLVEQTEGMDLPRKKIKLNLPQDPMDVDEEVIIVGADTSAKKAKKDRKGKGKAKACAEGDKI